MSSSYFGRDDDDDSVRYYDTDGNEATYKGPGSLDRAIKGNFGSKTGFLETAGGLVKEVFKNAEKRRDRDNLLRALQRPAQPFGGAGLAGRSFQLGDGSLTQINPDTFAPIVIPGGGAGMVGGRSTGQRIAGAATGALSGAASGAAIGAKLGTAAAPGIGTAIGAGIGLLGGLFG
jgi:hypothetical protein|tara:strand:+ start:29 stop:553 length:525 start_codon:yes stop_codon:yes gene_type:complete